MKNLKKDLAFVCSAILLIFTSCLDDNNSKEDTFVPSAEILSFSVYRDKTPVLPVLDSLIFHIDQVNGSIYNPDSISFDSVIPQYVQVKYTAAGYGFYNMKLDDNGNVVDSVWVNSGDSIDFSKPLRLKSLGGDGVKFKIYTAQLNKAKTDPYLMQYKQIATGLSFMNTSQLRTIRFGGIYYTYSNVASMMELNSSIDAVAWQNVALNGFPADAILDNIAELNGKLYIISQDKKMYTSTDAANWSQISLNYPVVTLMGAVQPGPVQQGVLACIVESGGKFYFASTSGDGMFTLGNLVPSDFPAQGFASFSYERMNTQYLSVAGGENSLGTLLNTVWSTENGIYWTMISEANGSGRFPVMTGGNIFLYNGSLMLLNGKLSSGDFNANVYVSQDNGIYWTKMPQKYQFPTTYTLRYNASVVLGDKNIFYIFGGENTSSLTDCWSGRQNRMIVD